MARARRSVANTAADPTIQFAELDLGGQVYKLAYSFNAIAEAEVLANCNLLEGISAVLFNTMTAAQLRALFFAALGIAHPKITLEQAGEMIRLDTIPAIRAALLEAYDHSLPEEGKLLRPIVAGGDLDAIG